MEKENINTIVIEDTIRVEEVNTVDKTSKEKIKRCFDYTFFKEVSEIIQDVGKELNKVASVTKTKNELVFGTGWFFFRAGKVQDALAKCKYGDVFIAHTTRLGEIRKNRIGLSITTGKDIKSIIRNPKKYLQQRVSVNRNLEAQLSFDEAFEVESDVLSTIEEKYDITGVLMYHMDDKNRLEILKVVFFDPLLKNTLLVLHAPSSVLYTYKDELEDQDSKIIKEEQIKEDVDSLKQTLKIK